MANFREALIKLLENEGSYVNDSNDPGGETYKGIARGMHSKWQGWVTIDMLKKQTGFPENLNRNISLQEAIEDFYQVNFWDKIGGDLIQNQEVAFSIFDFAVNAGVGTSASFAQMVVGASQDGVIGNKTIEKINSSDPEFFLAEFTLAKIARYINIVKRRPQSKKYFYGWACRALGD